MEEQKDTQTHENDLVFEVMMAPKDHEAIIARMSELLSRLTIAGTIFFMALCFIMSFIVWFLIEDISKSNSIIIQGNAEIVALKAEEADLHAIINNQKQNRVKLNKFYSQVPSLLKNKVVNHTQVIKVPMPVKVMETAAPGPVMTPTVIIKKVPVTTNISVTPPPNRNSRTYNKPPSIFPYWIYDKFNKKYHDRYNTTKGL